MNSGEVKPNRIAARSGLALLYIFLALFPFLVGTSHSRAQVTEDEQTLAFHSEIVASGGLAGAAQAAASLPLHANGIAQQTGIVFAPSSWILIGLVMMLCAYLGSRWMKRDAEGALR